MNGYRDDHAAAEERLGRLEVVAAEREHARGLARLDELRIQRARLDVRTRAEKGCIAVRYLAVYIGIQAVRSGTSHPAGGGSGSLLAFGFALALLVGSFFLARAMTHDKRASIRAIDREMDATMAPHVRVAPSELAEIHARIAELEADEAADVTPPLRTPRSAGTSR